MRARRARGGGAPHARGALARKPRPAVVPDFLRFAHGQPRAQDLPHLRQQHQQLVGAGGRVPRNQQHEVDNSLEVYCVVSAVAKTGVEMEAIMGVNAALITIYDLSKIVNPHLKIDNVKLLIKEGGKSGLWKNPDGLPQFLKNIF